MSPRPLLIFLVALAALPAPAEEPAPPPVRRFEDLFRRLDRDGDGRVAAAEMGAPELVQAMDEDRDGFVTIAEVRAYFANRPQKAGPENPSHKDSESKWVTPQLHASGLQYRTFDSAAAGTKVSFHVYVPEIYSAEKERRFPVLYWLHGSGGGLAGVAELAGRFDSAVRAGKIQPILVVFPNGLPEGMWCDSKDGKTPVETIVIKELMPHVDSEFRTIAGRDGRIVEGFSMGGYGAARFGFGRTDLFGTVSMLAAGPLHPEFETRRVGPAGRDALLRKVYGGDLEYYRKLSPWRLAEENAEALRVKTRLRIIIGERDETLGFNRSFHEHLEKLAIPHTFTVVPGIGHDPRAMLDALGDSFWKFHREALENPSAPGRK